MLDVAGEPTGESRWQEQTDVDQCRSSRLDWALVQMDTRRWKPVTITDTSLCKAADNLYCDSRGVEING